MKKEYVYIGKSKWRGISLIAGLGFSTALWHIKRYNGSEVLCFLHAGFMEEMNDKLKRKASVAVITVMWLTVRIGILRDRN